MNTASKLGTLPPQYIGQFIDGRLYFGEERITQWKEKQRGRLIFIQLLLLIADKIDLVQYRGVKEGYWLDEFENKLAE